MSIKKSNENKHIVQDSRLETAEQLLRSCIQEFEEIILEIENDNSPNSTRSLTEIMRTDEYYPAMIKNIQKFLDSKE